MKNNELYILRKIDELGRVVIPKELRQKYGLSVGSALAFSVEEGQIVIRKYDTKELVTSLINGVDNTLQEFYDNDYKNIAPHIKEIKAILENPSIRTEKKVYNRYKTKKKD